jgi:hypothetical protein
MELSKKEQLALDCLEDVWEAKQPDQDFIGCVCFNGMCYPIDRLFTVQEVIEIIGNMKQKCTLMSVIKKWFTNNYN